MTNTNQPAKKPIFRKQLPGGISTAVFENTRENGRTYRSINLQRSYRKDNKWQRMSMYLNHEDIPFVIEVLQGTWAFLNETPAGEDTDEVPDTEAEVAA